MTKNLTVTAKFARYSLKVADSVRDQNRGTVTTEDGTIACGAG